MEIIESLQKLIPWAANLSLAPKLVVSIIVVSFAVLVLLLIWSKPLSEPSSASLDHDPVSLWINAAKIAKSSGLIHSDRPLPTEVISARAAFEMWWLEAGIKKKKNVDPKVIYDALSLNSRLYRLHELNSESKPSANYWADQAIRFFEEIQKRELLVESLLDKGAILLELSQIQHTDPESFREIAKVGDSVMARAASIADQHQKAETFRIWSRMYYNLSRPKSGNLTENWDNNYLLTAHEKMLQAYELKPNDIKNVTQLARVTQKAAANPPQDTDSKWTETLRDTQSLLIDRWSTMDTDIPSPHSRVPPLNILGVLTIDVVNREWADLDPDERKVSADRLLSEIDDIGLKSLREVFALIRNTEWEEQYDFDIHYDLARIQSLKVIILIEIGSNRAEEEFREVIANLGAARKGGTSTQNDAAYNSVDKDPNFAHLPLAMRDTLKGVFHPASAI